MACNAILAEPAQVLKEAAAGSEDLERVSKQIHTMEGIAKAYPMTDPQVDKQLHICWSAVTSVPIVNTIWVLCPPSLLDGAQS